MVGLVKGCMWEFSSDGATLHFDLDDNSRDARSRLFILVEMSCLV